MKSKINAHIKQNLLTATHISAPLLKDSLSIVREFLPGANLAHYICGGYMSDTKQANLHNELRLFHSIAEAYPTWLKQKDENLKTPLNYLLAPFSQKSKTQKMILHRRENLKTLLRFFMMHQVLPDEKTLDKLTNDKTCEWLLNFIYCEMIITETTHNTIYHKLHSIHQHNHLAFFKQNPSLKTYAENKILTYYANGDYQKVSRLCSLMHLDFCHILAKQTSEAHLLTLEKLVTHQQEKLCLLDGEHATPLHYLMKNRGYPNADTCLKNFLPIIRQLASKGHHIQLKEKILSITYGAIFGAMTALWQLPTEYLHAARPWREQILMAICLSLGFSFYSSYFAAAVIFALLLTGGIRGAYRASSHSANVEQTLWDLQESIHTEYDTAEIYALLLELQTQDIPPVLNQTKSKMKTAKHKSQSKHSKKKSNHRQNQHVNNNEIHAESRDFIDEMHRKPIMRSKHHRKNPSPRSR